MSTSNSALSKETFFDHGARKLTALADVLGFHARRQAILDLFGRLISPWGNDRIGTHPKWRSEVGDDHSPYEFSAAFGKESELRILLEPLADPPSLAANRDAGLALHPWLARDYGIDLSRFERVRELFLPARPQGAFSVWYAATFWRERAPEFKIYLNPQAWGPEHTEGVVEEALVRLGFGRSWPHVARLLRRDGGELDEIRYFSLDLSPSDTARIKVYVRHHLATAADLEAAAAGAQASRPGDIERFLHEISGWNGRVFSRRPPATCLSFVAGRGDAPTVATHHFPINGYAINDQDIHDRVTAYLTRHGLDVEAYQHTARALIQRPLEVGIGQQSYVSFRPEGPGQRVTIYFPPELYTPGQIDLPVVPPAPTTGEALAQRLAAVNVTEHPLWRRVWREPLEDSTLLRTIVDTVLGVLRGTHAPRRALLARLSHEPVIAWHGVGEHDLGEVLVRNEGDLQGERSSAEIEAERQLVAALLEILGRDEPYEGVGALAVVELATKQILAAAADRVQNVPLHGCFPPTPLGDGEARVQSLASAVPTDALAPAWQGARAALNALFRAFDSLYALT